MRATKFSHIHRRVIVPPAPAIANAIHAAIGMRMSQTPMNPGRILQALKNKRDAAS